MPNATDFIGSVYDTLSQTLNLNGTSTNSLMMMAWPGYTLSPSDFKALDNANGSYDPGIAEETFTTLSNIAPLFNKLRFENSAFEIDDLYEILISSAIPLGAKPEDVQVNPIHKLFSDAQFELLNMRRGSRLDPNLFYYPCGATPNNWYDEAAAQSWSQVNIKSSDVKPLPPDSSFKKVGGVQMAETGIWKVKPANINETIVLNRIKTDLAAKNSQMMAKVRNGNGGVTSNTRPLNLQIGRMVRGAHRGAATINAGATRNNDFATHLSDVRATTAASTHFVPTPVLANTTPAMATLAPSALNKNQFTVLPVKGISLAGNLLIREMLNQQLERKPVSPATDGFSISFKYCRVNITRPWFKLALLQMANWYMAGTPKDQYSNASAEDNPGTFPLLPTSFVAIRDLKITANWSQDDKNNIANSAAFGPFDIRNGTFNQNSIEVKGLQVIAWISKVTPHMPPAAA